MTTWIKSKDCRGFSLYFTVVCRLRDGIFNDLKCICFFSGKGEFEHQFFKNSNSRGLPGMLKPFDLTGTLFQEEIIMVFLQCP